jgi:hypothetical protein
MLNRLIAVVILTGICAMGIGSGAASAQQRFGLAQESYAVFQRWANGTCIGEEAQALRDTLRAQATVLTPAFRQALIEGPTAEEIAAVRAAAERNAARRASFPIREFRIVGVNREALAQFSDVTQRQFVDDQVRRYVLGYRANAVAALGALGDTESRALLERIVANRQDPLSEAARAALQAR